jgi:type II secretory pathway component PulF
MRSAERFANFADVLALLIEHRVPLHEAVALAGEASADRKLRQAGAELAEKLHRARSDERREGGGQRTIPPYLVWLITSGLQGDQLVRSLRQLAGRYRRRAIAMGDWLTTYLPIYVVGGVGATITLLFGLMVFAPFYHFVWLLTIP